MFDKKFKTIEAFSKFSFVSPPVNNIFILSFISDFFISLFSKYDFRMILFIVQVKLLFIRIFTVVYRFFL